MKIKICGLRRAEDIKYINHALPDYAGFVLAPSKRQICTDELKSLSKQLDTRVKRVGVFVNSPIDEVLKNLDFIDIIQLHGNEDESYINSLKKNTSKEIWKAVRVKSHECIKKAVILPADKLLLDSYCKKAYGGTGKTADFSIIAKAKINKPFFIAGGITAQNMISIAKLFKPYGIDLSSSVEVEGVKNGRKIKEVIDTFSKVRDL